MKVLVVPEDPTYDQYILKPIVEQLCGDIGVPARVDVLRDPHLRGVDQALDPSILAGIVLDNPMIDLFLVMIDRDGNRRGNEAKAQARATEHRNLVVCLAIEEVEVWMLALHRDKLEEPWTEVRAEHDPKERFADPLLRRLGWTGEVGRGRKRAMRELGKGWTGLLQVCPELAELRARVREFCVTRP